MELAPLACEIVHLGAHHYCQLPKKIWRPHPSIPNAPTHQHCSVYYLLVQVMDLGRFGRQPGKPSPFLLRPCPECEVGM